MINCENDKIKLKKEKIYYAVCRMLKMCKDLFIDIPILTARENFILS